MSDPAFKSATIVLGMHRSGTSALAGLLGVCGLALPRTLVPAGEGNEKGFWESEPIKQLNDELMTAAGGSWHSLSAIEERSFTAGRAADRGRGGTLALEAEFPVRSDFVLKEPRLCRTLPYWKPVFASVSAKVGYAHVVRHPMEVAQSLARRNDFAIPHGLLLWARYALDAEHHSRGAVRAFISYGALLNDWRGSVEALSSALTLPIELDTVDGASVDAFLVPALRHHVSDRSTPIPAALGQVAEIYDVLRRWSQGESATPADHETLDAARAELDRGGATLAELVESSRLDRKRWAATRDDVKNTKAELNRAQRAVQQLGGLEGAVRAQSLQLQTVEKGLKDELAAAVERLNEALQQRQALADELTAARRAADDLVSQHADERALITHETAERVKVLESRVAEAAETARADAAVVKAAQVRIVELERACAKGEENAARLAEAKKRLQLAREDVTRLTALAGDLADAAKKHSTEREQWSRERARVSEKHADALAASHALLETSRRTLVQVKAEHATAIAGLEQRLKASERSVEDLQQTHAAAAAERDHNQQQLVISEAELGRVKHKYRAAQFDTERERRSHAATRAALAQAEAELARYRRSLPVRIAFATRRLQNRLAVAAARFSGAKRKRRSEAFRAANQSGIFDGTWYLTRYPDVANAGLDPLTHFMDHGWREGRDPGPGFATSSYLKAHADVASAGTNPLLHYIEFGHSEGREIRTLQAPAEPATISHDFAQAAEVFRGDAEPARPLFWRRSCTLAVEPDVLVVGGQVVGRVHSTEDERHCYAAFAALADLSGYAAAPAGQCSPSERSSASMIDAWFSNAVQLRTRWRTDNLPTVVRAFQHDPAAEGALVMVGEGALHSGIDAFVVNLANPYFPVLFVFAELNGVVMATSLLAFPSLCRGGMHYPEYLARGQNRLSPDLGDELSREVLETRKSGKALVPTIVLDRAGSDGTSPLLDSRFAEWLRLVLGVEIEASGEGARKGPRSRAKPSTNRLLLPANCVPTISILAIGGVSGRAYGSARYLSLLVANGEPSQPVALIRMPEVSSDAFGAGSSAYPVAWPRLLPGADAQFPKSLPPAAIRLSEARDEADAELLVPAMGWHGEGKAGERTAISWILFTQEWPQGDLLQSLIALSLQTGSEEDVLVLVGEVDADQLAAATARFGGRLICCADASSIAPALRTGLAAYLGSGTILHAPQTATVLRHFLQDPSIASAACAIVHSEKRGKGWHVSLADAGTIIGADSLPKEARIGRALWRSAYPVTSPPDSFWVARTAAVKKWLGNRPPQRLTGATHLCTTLITASGSAGPNGNGPEIRVPPAADDQSLKVEVLFG